MASAYVLFEILGYSKPSTIFSTKSGDLIVSKDGSYFTIDFPLREAKPVSLPPALSAGLGMTPREVLAADDYIAVFDHEDQIKDIQPNLMELCKLDLRGVVITAKGSGSVDFVSRMFGPKDGRCY